MRIRMSVANWALAAAVIGGAALAAAGQSQTADDDQLRPTFRTEANYVRIDVFATLNGEPVADLRPEDFEVLDEGVTQDITQFEYVQVRGNVPQDTRREPNTVAESREMLTNPRARVFVLFLDMRHVDAGASRQIGQTLNDTLDSLIGVDDLVAAMTPDMSVSDLTFGRKTVVLQALLNREWWGEQDQLISSDPVEQQYEFCYPPTGAGRSAVAQELIDRRRERLTLDSLGDLVRYLRGAREERKALLLISQGWRLFEPNPGLVEQSAGQGMPVGIPLPGVVGRGTAAGDNSSIDQMMLACQRDAQTLANMNSQFRFRELMDAANRANASFYPVDPRGLTVFDAPIGPATPPSPAEDRARLRDRIMNLRELAERTDGLAVVNTNNIAEGLQRVVDDLSSYYLLGYYATGVEMDGKFHRVRVRVNRPGLEIRARRGYLAPSPEELAAEAAVNTSASSLSAAEIANARGVERALGSLAGFSRELPLRIQVAAGLAASRAATLWVVGEVGRDAEWAKGASIDVVLTGPDGETVTTGNAQLDAGTRHFEVTLDTDDQVPSGEFSVRVRARGTAAGSLSTSDTVRVVLPDEAAPIGARFIRRGPVTGNQERATADLRFRRNERLRAEVPWTGTVVPSARVLDRAGQPLAVPVVAGLRETGSEAAWATAEVALAPLAAGDYVIEITDPADASEARRVWVGFRVVP
jgi:VWFA-related protein